MIDQGVSALLDEDNPWPALSAFDEVGRPFFNGRREETVTLRRLVEQAPLTVLFGKSGLGKTSLLKAGLFPRLRADRCLPVYVRLNVQDREQPLVEQFSIALFAEVAARHADAPELDRGETIWEYLHRQDLEIWSAQNQLVMPVFVLDQFEEVFTLGLENAAAVADFRVALADLVENRIPAAVARAGEGSQAATERLDLQRQPYKLLLSFREDYLPVIESWKSEMPSLLRNRLRLLPMTGDQAFSAVHETAPKLTSRAIAADVVRFVANADRESASSAGEAVLETASQAPAPQTPLADLVVEPALLSLVCHGLNEQRKRDGKPALDGALLQGSARAIIEDFYQGAIDDLPARVRSFIETELITERGFRKPCALDDARSEYGITDEELGKLVNRRLLRIEPYQGIDRVELIHDVLTPVVRQSREQRRAEARLAEERARSAEEGQRQRQRRWRQVLAASAALLTIISLTIGWLASTAMREGRRAQEALRVSRARMMAAVGQARLDVEPNLALRLALESLDVEPTAQGESLLRQSVLRTARFVLRGHEKPVHIVAASSDGRRVLTGSVDGSVRVWDPQSGAQVFRLSHTAPVVAATFSPDGAIIATATADGQAWVWRVENGQELRRRQTATPDRANGSNKRSVSAMAFGDDSSSLAMVWTDGAADVWNVATGAVASLSGPDDTRGAIRGIWWQPGSRRVVAVDAAGVAWMWDLRSPRARPRTADLHGAGDVSQAVPNADGKLVALVGVLNASFGRSEGFIQLTDGRAVETPKPATTGIPVFAAPASKFQGGHSGSVLTAAFTNDGRLVTGGEDGAIVIWSVSTGSIERTLRGHTGPVRSLSLVGKRGEYIISGGDDSTSRIWSLSALPVSTLRGHEGYATSVAFSPDGRKLASGGFDGVVFVWDVANGNRLRELKGHKSAVYTVAFSPDGRLVASAGGTVISGGSAAKDVTIRFWNAETGALVRQIAENPIDVLTMAFTPDGRLLVTGGADEVVRLWTVETGQLDREWKGLGSGVLAVSVSPDGRSVAAAAGTDVRIWSYETGAVVKLSGEKKGPITACVFSVDGRWLLTASLAEPDVVIWDVSKGTEARRFRGYEGANSADMHRGSALAATADASGAPKLWDISAGAILAWLTPAMGAWSIAFSPDGSHIAAPSSSGMLYVWECDVCGSLSRLRELATAKAERRLTQAELRSILGE